MYASDLWGHSIFIVAVGEVLSITKMLVLQPLRSEGDKSGDKYICLRQAQRIMKCNYHKEIVVFVFFCLPILVFTALSRRLK